MSEINIFGVRGYETYIIDSNTVGVRPKWISIKDAVPDYKGDYLCYGKSGISIARYYDDIFFHHDDQNDDEITHWMPLPEKP